MRLRWLCFLLSLVGVGASSAETWVIDITEYRFVPNQLQIQAGDSVRWINRERRTSHSILFEVSVPMATLAGLESPRLFPGEAWEVTLDNPGDYRYTCGPHTEMHGGVTVLGR